MTYDNTNYWKKLHAAYEGELKAVGHPFLSEVLNVLKYRSETKAVKYGLQHIIDKYKEQGKDTISILDIGAGTGYWTNVVSDDLSKQGFKIDAMALDISDGALEGIRQRYPNINTLKVDLKTIDPEELKQSFDLVISFYCLHHLTNTLDFVNGTRFSSCCVKHGGFLLLMDPILKLPYSQFDTINFETFKGNGIPRHLYFIDDLLNNEGLSRQILQPAVSFILNGNIEAHGYLSHLMTSWLWKFLCRLYRSEYYVQLFEKYLSHLDEILKNLNLAYSSSLCIYHKV